MCTAGVWLGERHILGKYQIKVLTCLLCTLGVTNPWPHVSSESLICINFRGLVYVPMLFHIFTAAHVCIWMSKRDHQIDFLSSLQFRYRLAESLLLIPTYSDEVLSSVYTVGGAIALDIHPLHKGQKLPVRSALTSVTIVFLNLLYLNSRKNFWKEKILP